jgi:hypothetical protein
MIRVPKSVLPAVLRASRWWLLTSTSSAQTVPPQLTLVSAISPGLFRWARIRLTTSTAPALSFRTQLY